MFYLNTIEQLFLFVEQLDQLEVCLPYSRLLTGILAVFQNLRWNSNKTPLIHSTLGMIPWLAFQVLREQLLLRKLLFCSTLGACLHKLAQNKTEQHRMAWMRLLTTFSGLREHSNISMKTSQMLQAVTWDLKLCTCWFSSCVARWSSASCQFS